MVQRTIEELQADVAAGIAEREAAKEEARAEREAIYAAEREIRNDASLTQEVKDYKSNCLAAFLDSGGKVSQFAKAWPELRLRWITERAAAAANIGQLRNF
jgi:hypothetical protein